MAKSYQLWDTRSRNLIGAFATEGAALEVVRESVRAHGPNYADEVALVVESSGGRSKTIATGAALATRSEEVVIDHAVGVGGLDDQA